MSASEPLNTPPAAVERAAERWSKGYGVIAHSERTRERVQQLGERLTAAGKIPDPGYVYRVLSAADHLTSAAMWLVVHMTYGRNVYRDGRPLGQEDFKPHPEGHTGGSLNMVPAYVGYLAANALTGNTRSWLMGQGHCVSAIEAVNLLTDNMNPAHSERYDLSDAGLTRFVRDFYAYTVDPRGRPESPLGSHVNAYTAGGMMEGGYLGFAELQYVHMPLPGERLVAFFSDGAFEEQRGSDWAPRWWRNDDSGLVTPFMILNGRRIDQRSSMAMKGGPTWLSEHLRLNGFSPVPIDGRDPADFAWGIIDMENRLERSAAAIREGREDYPAPLCYGIAETEKGFGFPGEGSNRAHNLPLGGNPAEDTAAREAFNTGAGRLWVDPDAIELALQTLNRHTEQGRPREREHPLAHRRPPEPVLPEPEWQEPGPATTAGAMDGVDGYFCAVVDANPKLRPRVGNPDEMDSNHLSRTLERLKHRVTHPEPEVPESTHGGVITALNEEAVVSAALGNKGGINLVASYEAFAVKMLGAIRQEIIFARNQRDAGHPPGWLAVPVIATSHTWENGKNEHSHQDPTFAEALMGEMADASRVLFPGDWNSAVAALEGVYGARGQVWTLVIAKRKLPVRFTPEQARQLVTQGAVRLRGGSRPADRLQLVATGAYQLGEVLKASQRLDGAGIEHSVVYLQEPGRFRAPRDEGEMSALADPEAIAELFPDETAARVFLTHTRPAPYIGTVWSLLKDPVQTPVLGYINQGGTLNEDGMLFANRSTWAHVVAAAATALGDSPEVLLNAPEMAALMGEGEPTPVLEPRLRHLA